MDDMLSPGQLKAVTVFVWVMWWLFVAAPPIALAMFLTAWFRGECYWQNPKPETDSLTSSGL